MQNYQDLWLRIIFKMCWQAFLRPSATFLHVELQADLKGLIC